MTKNYFFCTLFVDKPVDKIVGKECLLVDKFLGVGLVNAVGISIFVMLFIVVMKIIFSKWQVPGITDIVLSV